MAINVFRETHFRKESIIYFSFYSKHNILSDSAFFRWLSFSGTQGVLGNSHRSEVGAHPGRVTCPSRSTICLTLPVLCLKREKNTSNQEHTLNISMECMIASAASIIPWSDDFQWFLIQKVNCEAVVVVCESFVISLLQFSFQQSQVYRALSLSRVMLFSLFFCKMCCPPSSSCSAMKITALPLRFTLVIMKAANCDNHNS